ncbi:MAG: ribosome maturation factor RimP [candidate division WOR-3 bacterium]|nr:MAG: ribosome maturation factor RimP [candidate division WOR-3 bacterium]
MDRDLDLEGISRTIREVIEDMGLRFYDFDYNDVSRTLRVYIDKEKGGVTIGDCQKASNTISRKLDEDDLMNFPYTLEVSSPGVERILKKPEHYAWAVGNLVEIDTGREKIRGYLRGTKKNGVVVSSGNGEKIIHYASIKRANVIEE